MEIKTSELTGTALDWAVAKCEGIKTDIPAWADKPWVRCTDDNGVQSVCPEFSTDWAQGGPIIEREKIGIDHYHIPPTPPVWISGIAGTISTKEGQTPLIAAMRCFVASKLGYEVDVPEELL